jgi:hypothetical protein
MDKTIGQTGQVKSVDHPNSLVLVQFYNPELAALNEWWYHIKVLEKCEQAPVPSPVNSLPSDTLQTKLTESNIEMTNIYARRTLLSLLNHVPFAVSDGAIQAKDALALISAEPISTSLFSMPAENEHAFNNQTVSNWVLAAYRSGVKTDELTQLILKECTRILGAASKLATKPGLTVISSKPPNASAQQIKVEGARTLVVMFDRPGTFFPASSQASISFYLDEGCVNQICSYTEKAKFTPFVVPSSEFWYKFVCPSSSHRNNAKFRFSVFPGELKIDCECI